MGSPAGSRGLSGNWAAELELIGSVQKHEAKAGGRQGTKKALQRQLQQKASQLGPEKKRKKMKKIKEERQRMRRPRGAEPQALP